MTRGYGADYGGLTAGGRDLIATWRNSTIDRPPVWSSEALNDAMSKVKEHGYDPKKQP